MKRKSNIKVEGYDVEISITYMCEKSGGMEKSKQNGDKLLREWTRIPDVGPPARDQWEMGEESCLTL